MTVQWTCRFIKNDDHAETTGHRNQDSTMYKKKLS